MKYYHLMALVCEDLVNTGTKAIEKLVRGGHEATGAQLTAVRVGRSPNITWLIDLVREALPDFPIPKEVLPDTPAPVLAPAGASSFQLIPTS